MEEKQVFYIDQRYNRRDFQPKDLEVKKTSPFLQTMLAVAFHLLILSLSILLMIGIAYQIIESWRFKTEGVLTSAQVVACSIRNPAGNSIVADIYYQYQVAGVTYQNHDTFTQTYSCADYPKDANLDLVYLATDPHIADLQGHFWDVFNRITLVGMMLIVALFLFAWGLLTLLEIWSHFQAAMELEILRDKGQLLEGTIEDVQEVSKGRYTFCYRFTLPNKREVVKKQTSECAYLMPRKGTLVRVIYVDNTLARML